MCSASSMARLMEATVASMFTTTPLRSPFDGCEPMPMMSMPSSVISPTMAQILVVPMSSPTRTSPLLPMSDSSLAEGAPRPRRFVSSGPSRTPPVHHAHPPLDPHGHPVRVPPVVEVDHLALHTVRLEPPQQQVEPLQLARQVSLPEPDLHPLVARVHRGPQHRVEVHLGDRGAPVQTGLPPAPQH